MTIENLQCFLYLAQELNFTRAAERAHVAQSTMSRKLDSIETELGVRLFERNQHEVLLTSAGKEFYTHIKSILDTYSNVIVRVQNIGNGIPETVQIGVGLYENALLEPVMQHFVAQYPLPKINCLQLGYRELLDDFIHDRLDLILTSDQFLSTVFQDNLEMTLLSDSPWLLAINRLNPLAEQEVVEMAQLTTQNLITMNEGDISTVRNILGRYFFVSSIDYVNSSTTKLMMISANRGFGFIPSFLNLEGFPDIVTRPMIPPYLPRKYYAICKKDNDNIYVHHLMRILKQRYAPKL